MSRPIHLAACLLGAAVCGCAREEPQVPVAAAPAAAAPVAAAPSPRAAGQMAAVNGRPAMTPRPGSPAAAPASLPAAAHAMPENRDQALSLMTAFDRDESVQSLEPAAARAMRARFRGRLLAAGMSREEIENWILSRP